MCLEQQIHTEAQLEGLLLIASCNQQPEPKQEGNTMPKKYKRLMIALAAIASLYLVRATGLDQGLIDEVLDAAVEAVVDDGAVENVGTPDQSADILRTEDQ